MSFMREDSGSFAYITAAAPTTTQVKTGRGQLDRVTLNGPVATGVITIYDNIGADTTTPIAIITTPASPMPLTLHYGLKFSVGLKVVTSVAAQNITVVYK